MKYATVIIIAILAAASRLLAGPRATTAPTPPAMAIMVWQQPQANFQTWIARGCNGLCQIPTGTDWGPDAQQAWVNAAEAAGLWQARLPVPSAAADTAVHLLAWTQSDEPEISGVPSSVFAANYKAWKAIKPSLPVFCNFSGGFVLQFQPTAPAPKWTQATYAPFIAAGDWIGSDFYPNAWQSAPTQQFLQYPGTCVTTLAGYSGGKKQMAFVETGCQGIGPAGTPTAGQVRYEAWHAVMMGATGICYFPSQIAPTFAWDNSAPDVIQALPQLNSEFAACGPYLGTGLKGGPLNATFEYGEVKTGVNQLNVLLNTTDIPQSYSGVQLPAFGAYAVLVTPTGNTVLCQTPMPVPVQQQIDALNATVTAQGKQLANQQTQINTQAAQMSAAGKALSPATQP